jgi:hypothetical protein
MTAIHGKNAQIYLQGSGDEAVPVSELNDYSIDADFDLAETSELGDEWKTNVRGMFSWAGSINGNFDTASKTLWEAFISGSPRKFYLYPDRSVMASYYSSTCWVKLSTAIGGGTGDKAKSAISLQGEAALATT